MISDLKFALRQLRCSPGFAATVLATLALGIGAAIAIFSVVHAVVLQPLPFPASDRIVVVGEAEAVDQTPVGGSISPVNFVDWQRDASVFERLAAHHGAAVALTGRGDPVRVAGRLVTADYFAAYGVQPELGRDFLPAEMRAGGPATVILSHGFWQRQFGGAADIVGQTLLLDDVPRLVIAVMPDTLRAVTSTDVWMPLVFGPEDLAPAQRGSHYLNAVGRLRAGTSLQQARAATEVLSARLARSYPDTNGGLHIAVIPLLDFLTRPSRTVLYTLLGAVGILLLIACTNVANLLLARASARHREISLRAALGASRSRIVRQLLLESLVLAIAGGLLGIVAASWGVDVLLALTPSGLPRLDHVNLDPTILAVSMLLTLGTGLGFGLVPALQASRFNLVDALKDGARGAGEGRRGIRLRRTLVVAQVALAFVLLVGAGLLMRSFARLHAVSPGFNPENAYALAVSLPARKYESPEKMAAFADAVLERMRALPGIASAGSTNILPLSGGELVYSLQFEGRPARGAGAEASAQAFSVSPSYLEAMQIPVVRGRAFTVWDRAGAPRVTMINQAFAARYFPGENPIGRRIVIQNGPDAWREIVGIVGDVKLLELADSTQPQCYEPLAQMPTRTLTFVVRTAGTPTDLAASLRAAVQAVDPAQPVSRFQPLSALLANSLGRQRFALTLFAVFASAALLLAAIGVYGVMAWMVTRRTAEFGVRFALGAQRSEVLRLVFADGGRLVLAGAACGFAAALALARFLSSLLFEISPRDPATFVVGAVTLLAVAALACWLPARRAAKVDPMTALRAE